MADLFLCHGGQHQGEYTGITITEDPKFKPTISITEKPETEILKLPEFLPSIKYHQLDLMHYDKCANGDEVLKKTLNKHKQNE